MWSCPFTVSQTLILQTGQETDKEMEGTLDDVAKQLDKQALEEKEKDDDDEGKYNLSFLLTFPVSTSFWTPVLTNFTDGFGLFFSLGRAENQLYVFFTFFWQQFSSQTCIYIYIYIKYQ